ncbi:hypothetical protein ACWD0Z_19330 [Streptomyces sp. NPDC003007]
MEQFAGFHLAPVGGVVHAFAGDDDGGELGEVRRVDAHPAVGAAVVEVSAAMLAARPALEDVQLVGVGVAQRPELLGRRSG